MAGEEGQQLGAQLMAWEAGSRWNGSDGVSRERRGQRFVPDASC